MKNVRNNILKITILFGGASYEHEISIVSAITLKEKLVNFDLQFVFCDSDHSFYLIDPKEMKAVTFSKGAFKKMPQLQLMRGGFYHKSMFSKTEYKTTVLNLVHGGDGEDGTIAGLLDFYAINYIGPRINASVFSYDKRYTKYYADALGVKSVEYEIIEKGESPSIRFDYPIIIKPASLGSSIGVSIVRDESELDYALDVAFEFDSCVLVEPFLEGVKEYNLAGYKGSDGKIHFSIVEEPHKEEFLDFEKKYMDFSRSEQVLQADISQEFEHKLQSNFSKIYNTLFDGALIRCDFFVYRDEVLLNEINPIPGSMANYLFEDFNAVIGDLMVALPKKKVIHSKYEYIHSISQAKGK